MTPVEAVQKLRRGDKHRAIDQGQRYSSNRVEQICMVSSKCRSKDKYSTVPQKPMGLQRLVDRSSGNNYGTERSRGPIRAVLED